MPARTGLEQITKERTITDRNIEKFIITSSSRLHYQQASSF
jgi:hypothetical protein